MKKKMCVFGKRPEAIKMCPLINEMKKRKGLDGDGHACERIADILEKGTYSPWIEK